MSSGNCEVSTQTENTEPGPQTPCESQDERPPPEFHIDQDLSEEECSYCFVMPCITSQRNRQLCWESDAVPPSDSNHGIRKEKYKRFWTMMMHRGVWDDPRYKHKKHLALQRDPRYKHFVWHRREIMPKCVLQTVRHWLPNPDGVPYMGHLWD